MSLEVLAAGVVLIGLIAYAMFGGADFGGGVWTALSYGPRGAARREAIFRAMGPVWETNHIWLILVVVTLFTAFPPAFADLFTALLIPLSIALVGITFRGAAFAFRHFGDEAATALPATVAVFSIASILTPLTMGMALGAVAGGHIDIENDHVTSGLYEPWIRPFPIVCGLIGVAVCGFLTASYMTTRSTGPMREEFRNRAIAASLVLGALTTIAIPVAYWDASAFWDRLNAPAAIVVMLLAVAAGLSSLVVLWRRWWVLAPPAAAGTVALVIGAWGAVQYPYFILPGEKIDEVAAGHETLLAFLVALPIGALILVPSLLLLYFTFSENVSGRQVVDGD
ncbi:MAG: cytochrome d ubiquinol oxidase subunit II [Dehalococcoidia bacterium]|nr:MAG: cytochrome d ubiquinol oxidase subunit II [Dehalococcoidia bacterium]